MWKYHGSSHDTPTRQSEVHLKTSKHYASFQSFFAVWITTTLYPSKNVHHRLTTWYAFQQLLPFYCLYSLQWFALMCTGLIEPGNIKKQMEQLILLSSKSTSSLMRYLSFTWFIVFSSSRLLFSQASQIHLSSLNFKCHSCIFFCVFSIYSGLFHL